MSAAGDYQLGVDLGTTWTAAAVARDGQVEMVGLGNRSTAIPSVVHQAHDGTVIVGHGADRRGPSEPLRVAREFKRRIGDPTPVMLGGTPYAPEALLSALLRAVIDRVAELEGGPPRHMTLTHPANWGSFKTALFAEAVGATTATPTTTLTEPEAAAMAYAANERVEPGTLVAVYDLGGGTFDTAILRKTTDGFAILGQPAGIEHLGGIDFDEAVVGHVRAALGQALERVDPHEAATLRALTRLRRDCVDAKEALSSETEVTIPVLLPGVQTEVRLTRVEFEHMIRPSVRATIDALRRTLTAAAVEPAQVDTVLLVGGSSRIPLVAELVSEALGRPVAIDAHPKHAIALGAARAAMSETAVAEDAREAEVIPLLPTGRRDDGELDDTSDLAEIIATGIGERTAGSRGAGGGGVALAQRSDDRATAIHESTGPGVAAEQDAGSLEDVLTAPPAWLEDARRDPRAPRRRRRIVAGIVTVVALAAAAVAAGTLLAAQPDATTADATAPLTLDDPTESPVDAGIEPDAAERADRKRRRGQEAATGGGEAGPPAGAVSPATTGGQPAGAGGADAATTGGSTGPPTPQEPAGTGGGGGSGSGASTVGDSPQPDPAPQPEPDPVPQPEPDPAPQPEPDPVPVPDPDPDPAPAPDPAPDPGPSENAGTLTTPASSDADGAASGA